MNESMARIGALALLLGAIGGGIAAALGNPAAAPLALVSIAAARGLWLAREWGRTWALLSAAAAAFLLPWLAIAPALAALLAAPWRAGAKAAIGRFFADGVRAGVATAAVGAVALCFVARPVEGALSAPSHYLFSPVERYDVVDCNGRVRRVVGLPGDTVHVASGDVFVESEGRWIHARKPFRLQSRLWKPVPSGNWTSDPPARHQNGRIVTSEEAGCRLNHAPSIEGDDVRVAFQLTAFGTNGTVTVEVTQRYGTFAVTLSPQGRSLLELRAKTKNLQIALPDVQLSRGKNHRVELWVYDGQAQVVFDEIVTAPLEVPPEIESSRASGAEVAISASDVLIQIEKVELWRDVHFGAAGSVVAPPGGYVVVSDEGREPEMVVDRKRIRGRVFWFRR